MLYEFHDCDGDASASAALHEDAPAAAVCLLHSHVLLRAPCFLLCTEIDDDIACCSSFSALSTCSMGTDTINKQRQQSW